MNTGSGKSIGAVVGTCGRDGCARAIVEGVRHIITDDGTRYCSVQCYTKATGYGPCVVCGSLDAKQYDGDGKRIQAPVCHRAECDHKYATMSATDRKRLGLPVRMRVKAKTPRSVQKAATGVKKRRPKTNGRNKRRH